MKATEYFRHGIFPNGGTRIPGLLALGAFLWCAPSAYAAKSFKGVLDAEGTITFYYDDVDHSSEGTVRTHTAAATGYPPWKNDTGIQKAVFTPSCSSFAWSKGLQYFFLGCSNLTNVQGLVNLNTASASSFYEMFKDCSSLVSVDSGMLKSPSVSNFSDMFYNCASLEEIDISSLSSKSAAQCGNMFRGCSALTSICVRVDFDLSAIGSQWVFTGATKLVGGNGTKYNSNNSSSLYARIDDDGHPGYFTLKTVALTIAVSEFAEKHVRSVKVADVATGSTIEPDEEGGNVWTFPKGAAFNVTYTAANGYEFGGVQTYTDSSFAADGILSDETLEGAEIPSAVAFSRCVLTVDDTDFGGNHVAGVVVKDAITGAVIQPEVNGTYSLVPNFGFIVTYRAESGRFFANYVSATNVQTYATSGISVDTLLSGGVPCASIALTGNQIKGVVSDDDLTTMTLYCDNVAHEGVTYARKAATGYPSWANLTNILRVVVDPSVRANRFGEGGDGFQYLFCGLSSVTNFEGLANLKTDQATNFTQMFSGCRAVLGLDLSSFRTANARHYGEMFRYCSSLETVDISRFTVSANVQGCAYMFNGCAKLKTIYAQAAFDLKDVAGDDYMFTGCAKLVGGNGTTAISNVQHYRQYAHVDAPGNPGYFTLRQIDGTCVILK